MKEYLTFENNRNKMYRQLYMDIMTEVFGDEGILVAHHLCFANTDDKGYFTVQEIPAADTLIFDHEIMVAIFGRHKAFDLMAYLSSLPVGNGTEYPRDEALSKFYYARTKGEGEAKASPATV